MTPDQAAKFQALNQCTFAVGSPDKRFVRSFYASDRAAMENMRLTEAQAAYLDRLCWRYRKQLGTIMRNRPLMALRWQNEGKAAVAAHKAAQERQP